MKRMLPVVFLITILPTIVLVSAAFYVGNQFLATNHAIADGVSNTRLESMPGGREPVGQESDWIFLFDGKTMNGWEGNMKFFRVEDHSIVAGNLKSAIPRNEFLCTSRSFQNFELRLQAKLIGQGKNAGIQFRSQRIPDHHEVIGYQCDMGQMKNHSIWGFLYDESRRRKFLTQPDSEQVDKHTKTDNWNDLVIRCEGNRLQIWVNGFQTVDYTETDKKIARSGIIGLQIHSGPPAEAWYRNIKLKVLDPKK